jgi:hypothetical protein
MGHGDDAVGGGEHGGHEKAVVAACRRSHGRARGVTAASVGAQPLEARGALEVGQDLAPEPRREGGDYGFAVADFGVGPSTSNFRSSHHTFPGPAEYPARAHTVYVSFGTSKSTE